MSEETFFRHIRDEESQNDFFISLLSATLEHDATVLNAIHEDIEFTDQAKIVATQRSGLPRSHSENNHERTLDWVVRDKDKLVGYESKIGSNSPSNEQLVEEHRKLQQNSQSRDVLLYAFTDHPSNPINCGKAAWISWFDVAKRIKNLNAHTDSIRLLQKMFENEDYDTFDGFESFEQSREWFTRHEKKISQLVFDVDRHLDEVELYTDGTNNLPHHTDKKNITYIRKYDSRTINQSIHLIPFHPEGEAKYVDNYYDILLLASAFKNEIRVSMHLNTSKRDKLEEFAQSNSETLASIANDREMNLWTSWNRLNHPERELKEYSDTDKIEDVLSKKVGTKFWKQLYFGWEINLEQAPSEIVSEIAYRIDKIYEIFYEPAIEFGKVPEW